MKICHQCRSELHIDKQVGFRDVCPHCGWNLHVCLNCGFHEAGAYNECREPQAERVVDKDRNNFCEYFVLRDLTGRDDGKDTVDTARSKLDDLFKK